MQFCNVKKNKIEKNQFLSKDYSGILYFFFKKFLTLFVIFFANEQVCK